MNVLIALASAVGYFCLWIAGIAVILIIEMMSRSAPTAAIPPAQVGATEPRIAPDEVRATVDALARFGYRKQVAREIVDRALTMEPTLADAESIIATILEKRLLSEKE